MIGLAVNLASRQEFLTRQFPDFPILMSGELRELLAKDVLVEDLGTHALKVGRSQSPFMA